MEELVGSEVSVTLSGTLISSTISADIDEFTDVSSRTRYKSVITKSRHMAIQLNNGGTVVIDTPGDLDIKPVSLN